MLISNVFSQVEIVKSKRLRYWSKSSKVVSGISSIYLQHC